MDAVHVDPDGAVLVLSRNVLDVPYERSEILQAIRGHLKNGHLEPDTLYGDGRAGKRIAALLSAVPLTIEKRLWY